MFYSSMAEMDNHKLSQLMKLSAYTVIITQIYIHV